jgi:TonB-linked SusC/RagA family outer membrane protein
MKVFTLLLIFICLLTSVQLYGQKPPAITLSVKNVPLETVLAQIKKQTGITFVYNKEVLKITGKLSIQVEKADLETVLKMCFRNTSVNFSVYGNTVALSTKNDADGNMVTDSSFFSQGAVHGSVYDIHQKSLSGASVIIKRTHQGTITNAKGEFTIKNLRTNDTLNISFIGYDTQQVPIPGRVDFSFFLKETKNELDEVMVQAYGTTTKRLSVGEITQINAKDIERQPLSNPILALQGLVPGLLVTPTDGFTGSPVKLEIRGRNGIDPSVASDPLYIIDGVPLITLNIGLINAGYKEGSAGFTQSGVTGTGGQSPFFSLNPGDIESITVLKDAAATAMYGSRAGNGVILITTKKGKPGTTQFNVTVDQSVNKAIGRWDMLNTNQYLEMRREALRNDGITPSVANAPDLTYWDPTRYVDWQKEIQNTTKTTNVQTSLSGGNNFMSFRMGASYSAIQDLTALSDANKNKRAIVSLNLSHTSLNQKLSILFSAFYANTNTNRVSVGSGSTFAPNLPPILDQNGNLNYADWNAVGNGDSYPFSSLLSPSLATTYLLNSSATINYQLIKGLNISAALGYNNMQADNSYTIPIAAQNPIKNPSGTAFFGNNGNIGFNINPEANYEHYIGKGKLEITIGATLNSTTAKGLTMVGFGYTSDQLINSINNAAVQNTSQAYAQNKYTDVHARVNYNWKNKYIIQFSGNRDGSSSFGPGRQFGNFWSAGVNWIASEETWLKNTLPTWISLIKLSGDYGTTGISGGDYQYLSQWSANIDGSSSPPLPPYNGSSPLLPVHAVNQDYHWQTDRQSNLSLDLGFLSDRFNLHLSHYNKRVNDQLSNLPTPIFTGFGSVQGNSKANVQNTGWEGSLLANLISSPNFSWSARFNISANRNKLVAFPGIEYTPYYNQYIIGKSLNTKYLLHYIGISSQNGQRSYEDYNHDGQINITNNGTPGTGSDDKYIAIDPTPKFFGGASTSLRYKNLTLDLQFNYEKKIALIAYTITPGAMNNAPASILGNQWQKPGDIAVGPRFTTNNNTSDASFVFSDGAYKDGSFIRLNTVAMEYSLPDKLTKRLGVQGLRFAVAMQNIFTLTKYDGIDPDVTFGGQSRPKVFNGKITFNF